VAEKKKAPVKKCPHCGNMTPNRSHSCPKCSHSFVEATAGVKPKAKTKIKAKIRKATAKPRQRTQNDSFTTKDIHAANQLVGNMGIKKAKALVAILA